MAGVLLPQVFERSSLRISVERNKISVRKSISKNECEEGQNRRSQSADWVTLGD